MKFSPQIRMHLGKVAIITVITSIILNNEGEIYQYVGDEIVISWPMKKGIIYSGDVLNTAARIQGQCNQFGVDLLISKETFDLIPNRGAYELVPLGSIELRGKKRKIDLNTIRTI